MRTLALFVAAGGLVLAGCGEDGTAPQPSAPSGKLDNDGGTVVISRDQRVAVAVNRMAGIVSVFPLSPTLPQDQVLGRAVELDVGDNEPWAAVIGPDDDSAYVVLRKQQVVRRIFDLHGTPRLDEVVSRVGAEPTALAISSEGTLFVANFGEGTLSQIKVANFTQEYSKISLNEPLAGLLQVEPRVGLAHPRALALSDDGDGDERDETLYVTEFFSAPLAASTDGDGRFVDRNRQGLVYPLSLDSLNVGRPLLLPPVLDTGFSDGDGKPTDCFPNQLYAAAVNGARLFVSGFCTSPRGPLGKAAASAPNANFETALHPMLYVVDATGEVAPSPVLLTRELRAGYAADAAAGLEAEGGERMPLIPNDLVLDGNPNGSDDVYVTAFGADAVFRVGFDAFGDVTNVGTPGRRFLNLHALEYGRLPTGVALSERGSPSRFALVANETTRNLSLISLATEAVAAVATTTTSTRGLDEADGRQLFATGLDDWSLGGQAWSSCESCHPDGASDNVTWFFARGPRRTLSTAATYYGDAPERRALLWTANVDEVNDVEAIVRTVSGGTGGVSWLPYAVTPHVDCRLLYDGSQGEPAGGSRECDAPKHTSHLLNGLNGALASVMTGKACTDANPTDPTLCNDVATTSWTSIDTFLRSLRAPRAPGITAVSATGDTERIALDPAAVAAGRTLFADARCDGCHAGPGWTVSKQFYTPDPTSNGDLPYLPPAPGAGQLESMKGALRIERYLVPPELLSLNPPARNAANAGGENGSATFRAWEPLDGTEASALSALYATPNDHLNCALRAVGTFPDQSMGTNSAGIATTAAPPVLELKQDMKTLADGKDGFNVPSLLGLAASGPYFHAGNARTLEEVFDARFDAHSDALTPGFLSKASDRSFRVHALVQFLLSIDEDTQPFAIRSELDFCSQYPH